MVYNLTAVGNATNVLDFFSGVDTASGGLLGSLTLLSIFLILLFGLLRNNPVPESFTAASTVTVLVSLVFMYLNISSVVWVIGFTVVWAMSAIALYKSNSV